VSTVEAVATVFGLASVVLAQRKHVGTWPTGLVQVVLYVWVFFQAKLYSDVLLHVAYAILSVYGWIRWARRGPDAVELPVTRLGTGGFGAATAIAAAGTAALGYTMLRWTDAALPVWDAGIASFSLVAQTLLARKRLESWLFWIAVDVVAVGVYAAKGLYLTCGLYAVFLGLATGGWYTWRRDWARACAADAGSSSASSCPPIEGTAS